MARRRLYVRGLSTTDRARTSAPEASQPLVARTSGPEASLLKLSSGLVGAPIFTGIQNVQIA